MERERRKRRGSSHWLLMPKGEKRVNTAKAHTQVRIVKKSGFDQKKKKKRRSWLLIRENQ